MQTVVLIAIAAVWTVLQVVAVLALVRAKAGMPRGWHDRRPIVDASFHSERNAS